MDEGNAAKIEVDAAKFNSLALLLEGHKRLDFVVVSDSMSPLIEINDRIDVEPLRGPPRRFDILVFWDGARLICHYLWHINQLADPGEPPVYVTRPLGPGEDLPVVADHVLGTVVNFRIPLARRAWILWHELWQR